MARRAVRLGKAKTAKAYDHKEAEAVLRPDIGLQAQFKKKKEPAKYRYDRSLDPQLSWDINADREHAESLIEKVRGAKSIEDARTAAEELKRISSPFLNWAGKADRNSFNVPTLPLFTHERLSTEAILKSVQTHKQQLDLFADTKLDLAERVLRAYEHKSPWVNRLILGDSLVVMNSLVKYEALGGQVQCIYVDPPYGVKFGSNFQPFIRKRDVRHNDDVDLTREPEMVQAYRDTWELGLHSYLTYLRDRFLLCRELLALSGSLFVQISDENLHHVRELLDEVFGAENFCAGIAAKKTGGQTSELIPRVYDTILWYARDKTRIRYRSIYLQKISGEGTGASYNRVLESDGSWRTASDREIAKGKTDDGRWLFAPTPLTSDRHGSEGNFPYELRSKTFQPPPQSMWKTTREGLDRLKTANRIVQAENSLRFVRYINDFPATLLTTIWDDLGAGSFTEQRLYVVQTRTKVIERCVLMTTDPGDLVLDPTCGSGTTAYVAEQWGRRWITIDTSRVPLALTRQRLLTATFPYYELRDEKAGVSGGFKYERKQNSKGEEVESDTAVVGRVLGREVGGKQNVLVMNDEAHHCYRLVQERPDEWEQMAADEREDWLEENKEATVWIDGLDKIQKIRGVNFCVDLSATPYYLNRTGNEANRPFPWVVCDFSLVDSIESGLVKIPQLAIRDTTGAEIPAYFNIWRWIMEPGRLTSAERGGSKAQPKPEAVLKWAHTPIAQLAGLWSEDFKDWQKDLEQHPTPPVFIIVCRNTRLAKVLYEWIADDNRPLGIPALGIEEFRNRNGQINTIRVDSKVVHETDTEGAKNDEHRWMRFTLDTVGKTKWTWDSQGRPIYPKDFVELATKLERPLHPPGRDVRCIVSVAMLTEGWDCTTVTHIIGLRPFMSQLLCEQVVGRGLRRTNYQDLDDQGKFREEVAKVYGVPFEVIPFKTNKGGPRPPPVKRWHIHAVSPQKDHLEIRFPRVEGYTYAIRNRITVDWDSFPPVVLDPNKIPPEVEVKGLNVNNRGRLSLSGPGRADLVKLKEFRSKHRVQELEFELARALTKDCLEAGQCKVPAQALFPQLLQIVHRYLHEFVRVYPPNDVKDIFLSPYYGWVIERLVEAIRPDTGSGESPEVPRYEANRKPGSTRDVDLWTSREVREPTKSHLNYVVADTRKWEQSAAFYLDTNPNVVAFAKNSGLGFAIPYFHNGQMHDFVPDYLVRLGSNGAEVANLILEVKGYDERAEVKTAAAKRWCAAVNADEKFGRWHFRMVRNPAETNTAVNDAVQSLTGRQ